VDEEKSIETMVEDTTGKWATGGEAARDCGGRGLALVAVNDDIQRLRDKLMWLN
jgi:hypothetical protein